MHRVRKIRYYSEMKRAHIRFNFKTVYIAQANPCSVERNNQIIPPMQDQEGGRRQAHFCDEWRLSTVANRLSGDIPTALLWGSEISLPHFLPTMMPGRLEQVLSQRVSRPESPPVTREPGRAPPRCAQQAPARRGFPGALPQRRVVWMWFGAFPGAEWIDG